MNFDQKPSNSDLNRLGERLKISNCNDSDRREAMDDLNLWRRMHNYPLNTFQATLRGHIKKIDTTGIVAQRLKRSIAIVDKLENYPKMQFSRMQDVGGIRAIVSDISKLNDIYSVYKDISFQHRLVREKNYVDTPRASGYRSIHLVYEYIKKIDPQTYNGLFLELQLRTQIQHAWATAVESVGFILKQALKSSQGSEEWLEYFLLVSAGFACLENTTVPQKYANYSPQQIYKLITERTREINAVRLLRTYTIAVNYVNRSKGSYHLLELKTDNFDSEKGQISVTTFAKDDLDRANEMYMFKESTHTINQQIVLVSSSNFKNAYSSYFLNTDDFIRYLKVIEKLTK